MCRRLVLLDAAGVVGKSKQATGCYSISYNKSAHWIFTVMTMTLKYKVRGLFNLWLCRRLVLMDAGRVVKKSKQATGCYSISYNKPAHWIFTVMTMTLKYKVRGLFNLWLCRRLVLMDAGRVVKKSKQATGCYSISYNKSAHWIFTVMTMALQYKVRALFNLWMCRRLVLLNAGGVVGKSKQATGRYSMSYNKSAHWIFSVMTMTSMYKVRGLFNLRMCRRLVLLNAGGVVGKSKQSPFCSFDIR
ncbi:hypothetical protein J6590_078239 [Homalodisca vitripennis]|nr:hypothetical protein J6590_078239 [Homalodisca vitripennis]